MTATEENSQPAAAAEQVKPPETECKEWSDQLDVDHQETGFMITLHIVATLILEHKMDAVKSRSIFLHDGHVDASSVNNFYL